MTDKTAYPKQYMYDAVTIKEILEIAENYSQEDWNRVIAERKSWPILYEFSHIRENILSWLPFTGEEKVLEIGAGCGALTGILCQKAASVTCIEPSSQYCEINAKRNKKYQNLEILSGDFVSVERSLMQKFDYITLIDAFAYSETYIQSEDPYTDLIKILLSHLKPQGRILLGVQNRLGLKYWAGCAEDHTGILFEGLEGYPTTEGIKTFSRNELTAIFKRAEVQSSSWYYPYPDHRLPMTIYSDRRLPVKGELNRLETNYDRLRLQLFQESPVYDSLIENDLYPEFANSYLVLLGKEAAADEISYVKFSNERESAFAIRTEICKDRDGKRYVRKSPVSDCAWKHIQNLSMFFEGLRESYAKENLELNVCSADRDGVRFEYLEGETLEERLDKLLEEGKTDELEKLFFTYIDKIRRIHTTESFVITPEFRQVFGNVYPKDECRCAKMSDIDLVPANILIGRERVSVIDYEWTFCFPIPCNFILYRMIHYYLESDGKRRELKKLGFFEKAGITPKEQEIYAQMELNFQKYLEGKHVPLLNIYEEVSPGKADVRPYFEQLRLAGEARNLQVFYDKGRDFCEEDSILLPMTRHGICTKIPIPEGVRRLRLDPGEASGGLCLSEIIYADGSEVSFWTNGFPLGDEKYYFGAGDPQFIINEIPEGMDFVRISVEVLKEQEARAEFWKVFDQVSAQKEQEIRQLKQQISEMENTKIWKLYRGIKKK